MAKASAKGIRAGKAYVEIFADDSKMVRGLKAAQKKLNAFGASVAQIGKRMMVAGAAITGPIIAASKVFADYGDQIAKMAKRTGLAVDFVSGLAFAADQSATSMESIEKAMKALYRTLDDAKDGTATAVDGLRKLGLTARQLSAMSPEEQFLTIADRLSQIENPAQRAAAAMTVLGKSGAELLPMFADGAKGIRDMMAEAARRGLIISPEDAAAAEKLNDAYGALSMQIKMTFFRVGAAVAPILQDIAEWLGKCLKNIREWIAANPVFVRSALAVGAAMVGIGAGLIVVGGLIKAFAFGIGGLLLVFKAVNVVFGAAALLLGALLSPIGLVVSAIVGMAAIWGEATGATGRAISWLGERFGALANFAGETFGAIAKAMAAGEITLAADVLWAALQVAWHAGANALMGVWVDFKTGVIKLFTEIRTGVLASWELLQAGIASLSLDAGALVVSGWNRMVNDWKRSIAGVGAGMAEWWLRMKRDLGLISDEELQIGLSAVFTSMNSELAELDAELDAKKKEAAEQLAASHKLLDEQHKGKMAEIGAEGKAADDKADKDRQDALAGSQTALDAAIAAWKAAIAKIAGLPALGESSAPGGEWQKMIDKFQGMLSGVSLPGGGDSSGSAGTFQGTALAALASSGPALRTAVAAEITAKNTKKIVENTKKGATFK
jgi:hypothetical protein